MCIEGIEEISGGGGPTMPEEANEMEEAEHMAFFFSPSVSGLREVLIEY